MKNNQKGFVVPLIIIAALLIAISGVYLMGKKSSTLKTEIPEISSPSQAESTEAKIQTNKPVVTSNPNPKTIPVQTVSAGIKVISPNGGEKYKIGDVVKIKWQATGTLSSLTLDLILQNYCVTASNPGCVPPSKRIVGAYSAATQEYQWKITSDIIPGSYKIALAENSLRGLSDLSDNIFTITSAEQKTTEIQAYINTVDKEGQPFRPDKVEWYYPPINGQTTQYPASCVNSGCTRWSVMGAIGSKIYVVANYKAPAAPGASCFSSAYNAKPIELSSIPAEISLTMEPSSYCY